MILSHREILRAALVGLWAWNIATGEPNASDTRLVVVVAVDQLRADFLDRFGTHFREDGFALLRTHGASFENAEISYGSTATGPGHATMMTGLLPRHHGIVANKWFLAENKQQHTYAVEDTDRRIVGLLGENTSPGKSAHNLIGRTLGEQLKLRNPKSQVHAVSLKDRTAIFMAGHRADGVFWWDRNTGRFVTSTYYAKRLPEYVAQFNQQRRADRFSSSVWDRLLPAQAYAGCTPAKVEWFPEGPPSHGDKFPHRFPPVTTTPPKDYYDAVYASPFGNDLVLEIAEAIIEHESLGQDDAVDLLCVGLSSNDPCGHIFGPDSPEILDMTLRTDRQIAGLLADLDRQVGLDHCLVVLTADHGVTTPGAIAQAKGWGGGRLKLEELRDLLNEALKREFGPLPGADEGDYVLGVQVPWTYFHPVVRQFDDVRKRQIHEAARAVLRNVSGIDNVFTAEELSGPEPSPDDKARWRAWRCFHPERSGGLYCQLGRYWYVEGAEFAGHSPGLEDDRSVPILMMGPGIRPGKCYMDAGLADVAVTVGAAIGVHFGPNVDGKLLREALQPASRGIAPR